MSYNNMLTFTFREMKKYFTDPQLQIYIRVLFILGSIFFLSKFVIYAITIVITPVPASFREGAILLSTGLLLQGLNPYPLINHPPSQNAYDLGYNCPVMPIFNINASLPWITFLISGTLPQIFPESLISALAIIFLLGQHLNNYVVYLFQLMTPFMVIGLFQHLRQNQHNHLITVPLILMNFFILNYLVIYPNGFRPHGDDWRQIESLVAGSEQILNSPAITSMLIDQDHKWLTQAKTNIIT